MADEFLNRLRRNLLSNKEILPMTKEIGNALKRLDQRDVVTDVNPVVLKARFGSGDIGFVDAMVAQLTSMTSSLKTGGDELAFGVGAVTAMAPRDAVETMLLTQMVGIHNAIVAASKRFSLAQTIEEQDSAGRVLINLSRTYTMQLDALKRYRDGGKQKVTVEHVTVNEGGQAIVGNVTTKGKAHVE